MASFTLPRTPLGNFVRENYAPRLRRSVFTKLKQRGFTPPRTPAASGAPTAAQRRELPNTLIGVEGVRGPWRRPPRLNPADFVVTPNRYGTYFAQPRTDVTGLSPESLGQVKSYEAETGRRIPGIQSAYSDLGTALNQNADATRDRLASLGSSIASSPLVGNAAQQGVPDANAQLADARRAEMAANSAVTVGLQSALPALAGQEGTRAVEDYRTTRREGRTALIGSLREQEAAQAAAAQELAAQLRGQDLSLLGTQLSQAGQTERALLGAASRERVSTADLETRLLIAEMNGNVSEANSIRSALARQYAADRSAQGRAAGGGGGGQRQKDTQAFVRDVRGRLTGQYVKNPAYRSPTLTPGQPTHIPKPGSQTSALDVLADALAQKLKPLPVLNAIRAVIGPTFARGGGQEGLPGQILQTLLQGGVPREQAFKIVKAYTGSDLRPGAGAYL